MVNFQPRLVLLSANIPSFDTSNSVVNLFCQSTVHPNLLLKLLCARWCLFKPNILGQMGMIETGIQ